MNKGKKAGYFGVAKQRDTVQGVIYGSEGCCLISGSLRKLSAQPLAEQQVMRLLLPRRRFATEEQQSHGPQ